MAKTNTTTKKNKVSAPAPADDALPVASKDPAIEDKPATEVAAGIAAAVASPLLAKAAKLKRIIKQRAVAALAAPSNIQPPAVKTPSSGTKSSAAPANGAGKPKRATASPRATKTAPAPPPPIPGVSKPAPARAKRQGKKPRFTHDDVALRAYFIAQRRHAEGRHGNPETDWLEAESELRAEFGTSARL